MRDIAKQLQLKFRAAAIEPDRLFLLRSDATIRLVREASGLGLELAGVEGFLITPEGAFQAHRELSNDIADVEAPLDEFVEQTIALVGEWSRRERCVRGRARGIGKPRLQRESHPDKTLTGCPREPILVAMRQRKTRIMYIENKSGTLNGAARIGRVSFSKTGKSLTYAGRTFQSLKGQGFKANYFDVETGEEFWISGPRKDGQDRLYPESTQAVEVDADVAEEYWRDIRGLERAPA